MPRSASSTGLPRLLETHDVYGVISDVHRQLVEHPRLIDFEQQRAGWVSKRRLSAGELEKGRELSLLRQGIERHVAERAVGKTAFAETFGKFRERDCAAYNEVIELLRRARLQGIPVLSASGSGKP